MKSYWQSDLPGEVTIPVARPRLPSFDDIAPYLRRIEQSGWYSNGGPLVQKFEPQLTAHAGAKTSCVAIVANATIRSAIPGVVTPSFGHPAGRNAKQALFVFMEAIKPAIRKND
jgi:hypothetical protein